MISKALSHFTSKASVQSDCWEKTHLSQEKPASKYFLSKVTDGTPFLGTFLALVNCLFNPNQAYVTPI